VFPTVAPDVVALAEAFGYVDPELAEVLIGLPAIPFGTPSFGIPEARALQEQLPQPTVPTGTGVSHRDLRDDSTDGNTPHLRVITPDTPRWDRPCIYWIHGGGFVVGSPFETDLRLFRWAVELDCVVVAIQYGLAPEQPFPHGLEDCYAGLLWTAQHAEELGIDATAIAVVGESAGGGLAAGLTLLARDRGEIRPRLQLLIYPMLDDRTVTRPSQRDAPVWTGTANAAAWAAYLGPGAVGSSEVPIAAAPARAEPADLHGVPACYIVVGSVDLFREENVHYAEKLLDASVPTELHVYPGAFHASDHLVPEAAISRRFERDLDAALSRAFERVAAAAVSISGFSTGVDGSGGRLDT